MNFKIINGVKNPTNLQLNGYDLLFSHFFCEILIFDYVLSENNLVYSLKEALKTCPYMAGKIYNLDSATPFLTTNDTGILFITERFNESIQHYSPTGKHLDNGFIPPPKSIDENTPIFLIKLSIYNNASVLGLTFYHAVCDGYSFYNFLDLWGKISKKENHICKKPFIFSSRKLNIKDNNSEFSKKEFPSIVTDVNYIMNKIRKLSEKPINNSKKTFRLKENKINKIIVKYKEKGLKGKVGVKDSIWMAQIWKIISSNRLKDKEEFAFIQIYNARYLLGLNKNFFGNTSIYPYFFIKNDDIDSIKVEEIAERILCVRDNLLINSSELQCFYSFWNRKMETKEINNYRMKSTKLLLEGELLINNLTTQPIYKIDFGSGPPVWYELPNRENAIRNIHALPAPEKNGDIILFVTLPHKEMELFSHKFYEIFGK